MELLKPFQGPARMTCIDLRVIEYRLKLIEIRAGRGAQIAHRLDNAVLVQDVLWNRRFHGAYPRMYRNFGLDQATIRRICFL